MFFHHPSEVFYRVLPDFAFWLLAFSELPPLYMPTFLTGARCDPQELALLSRNGPRNTWSSSHTFLVLLLVPVTSTLECGCRIQRPKGIRFSETVPARKRIRLFLSCFLCDACHKADHRSRVVQNFVSPIFKRIESKVTKTRIEIRSKPCQLMSFLFGHHYFTRPRWFGRFYHVIL